MRAGLRRVLRLAGSVATGAVVILGLVYFDVVSRAKASYLKGETYLEWSAHPEKKEEALKAKLLADQTRLQKKRDQNQISDEEFQRNKDALTFDYEQALQESSPKYAYQWYKDTYELFCPPESKWVKLARSKAPVALELWKKELQAKKIPYDDTMLE